MIKELQADVTIAAAALSRAKGGSAAWVLAFNALADAQERYLDALRDA